MSALEITVARMKNKIRDDWMIAEQNLKLAIMNSVGETIRHIIAPPPLAFQNMSISITIDHNQSDSSQMWKDNTPYRQKNQRNPDREIR
jgi:hypothetical protein